MQPPKVLVAMSGGIDSSAVCILLREQGFQVVGMTMRVWDLPHQFSEGNVYPDFILKAQQLAQELGIEHHVIDIRDEFKNSIVEYFLDEYTQGRTPNPCVMCNQRFKFKLLEEISQRMGCDYVATGHYVKTEQKGDNVYLLMGDDVKKDQSYFLWRVPQETLRRCLFPLGNMKKTEVRKFLSDRGYISRSKDSESMEICFIENDYRDFIRQHRPELAAQVAGGNYVDSTGRTIGSHSGVPFYTVGQRKGLGIALGYPAYVLRLNAQKNTIVLGKEEDLQAEAFLAEDIRFVEEDEFFYSKDLTVRIRYHSQPAPCQVQMLQDGRLLVRMTSPVHAVTPGQSAVFYIGKRLVGGAVISSQKGLGGILAQQNTLVQDI